MSGLSRLGLPFAMLAVCTALLVQPLRAQQDDGATPPGHTPGAPAGSYALSDFDNINLFNGNLNFFGTPAVALVDARGVITKLWPGKLPAEVEQVVFAEIAMKGE